MGEEKSLLTRIGDAVEAAKDKAQEMGASLVKKAEGAATDAKREAGKARTLVQRKTRAATASVKRTAKSAEADARTDTRQGETHREGARPGPSKPMRRRCWARRSARSSAR